MALPTRLRRGRERSSPFAMLARNDFNNALSRLFGAGLFENVPDDTPVGHYGVDIREDGDHVYIEADLPGVRKEDVQVTINDGVLTIVAERREEIDVPAGGAQADQAAQPAPGQSQETGKQESTAPKGDYLLRERLIRRFVRSFALPPNVDEQHIDAKLENGVLRITLNKREDSKPTHVPVA